MTSHAASEYTLLSLLLRDMMPEYEWPGEAEEGEIVNPGPLLLTSLQSIRRKSLQTSYMRAQRQRLSCVWVVLQSTCLPSKRRLAILTGYPEVQLGRDRPAAGSVTPRIRLKEMESLEIPCHCLLGRCKAGMGHRDMGSMHGHFRPCWQLTRPRVASLPRRLRHPGHVVDRQHCLSPVDACASSAVNEIPLFSTDPTKPVAGVTKNMPPPTSVQSKDAKKSLSMLKQSLLRQHTSSSNCGPSRSSSYVDRAARRREMHGALSEEAAPTSSRNASTSVRNCNQSSTGPPKDLVSDPPAPLSESNVGHRLLSKMGWEPGTGLGIISPDTDDVGGIVNPIEVNHHDKRAGLGTKRPAASLEENWREGERQKRYDSLRATLYEGR
ncbi:angiogenic factor with G patch and FHA domains 1 [Coprinopsis sp. MPI-PUGE-AT-0042]|nr:angiogenic factor with G patch and FHA domains 1 [Coprinopsis sp. MPI-PUGE-AT-0042]